MKTSLMVNAFPVLLHNPDNMTTYELDPDVVRWGLHLLDNRPLSGFGSHSTVTYRQPDLSHVEYVRENYIQAENTNVENDEVIAYALQEEFKLLAAEELCRNRGSGEEHMRASVLAQDWFGPSKGHCLSKEYIDGGAGKSVNPMVPIRHVPKTNGELPSHDEEISDHQRLLQRLELYDLFELKVQGDGNCQFRALSDQLYGSSDHHTFVREQIVNQLKSHHEMYEGYVPMAYSDYSKKMNKNGEWGDHVTLQAAADWFGVKIFVITSFKDTCYIEILPHIQKSERIILLSFWAEVHYNSIYPEGDQPMAMAETKKKKKWWMFGI